MYNRNYIHNVTEVTEVINGKSSVYFHQLCLYLQNDETFDNCRRNIRVSDFPGHVVLRYKIRGSVAKRREAECPTAGGEQCAKDFEVENGERAPFNQRTPARLQLQVKSKTERERGYDNFLFQTLEFRKKQKRKNVEMSGDNHEVKFSLSLNCRTSKKKQKKKN